MYVTLIQSCVDQWLLTEWNICRSLSYCVEQQHFHDIYLQRLFEQNLHSFLAMHYR